MTQDFSDWQEDDFDEFSSDSPIFDDFSVAEDPDLSDIAAPEEEAADDEFDKLRRKSARAGTMFDDMETDSEFAATESGASAFSLSNFSTGQRLILALLLLLDVLMIGFGILVWMGRI